MQSNQKSAAKRAEEAGDIKGSWKDAWGPSFFRHLQIVSCRMIPSESQLTLQHVRCHRTAMCSEGSWSPAKSYSSHTSRIVLQRSSFNEPPGCWRLQRFCGAEDEVLEQNNCSVCMVCSRFRDRPYTSENMQQTSWFRNCNTSDSPLLRIRYVGC